MRHWAIYTETISTCSKTSWSVKICKGRHCLHHENEHVPGLTFCQTDQNGLKYIVKIRKFSLKLSLPESQVYHSLVAQSHLLVANFKAWSIFKERVFALMKNTDSKTDV